MYCIRGAGPIHLAGCGGIVGRIHYGSVIPDDFAGCRAGFRVERECIAPGRLSQYISACLGEWDPRAQTLGIPASVCRGFRISVGGLQGMYCRRGAGPIHFARAPKIPGAPGIAQEFVRSWLGQSLDAAVWTVLKQAARWADEYNRVVDLQLQEILGDRWTRGDKFTTPREVQHQLFEGFFVGAASFDPLRVLFRSCKLVDLAVGVTLREATQHMDAFCRSLGGHKAVFVLLSQDKASTVLCGPDSSYPLLHFDSHVCTTEDLNLSATFLGSGGVMLLQHLTRKDSELYDAEGATHLWAFTRESAEPWAAPDLTDLGRCSAACPSAEPDMPAKTEQAPSAVVGKSAFVLRMGTRTIDLDMTPPKKPSRSLSRSPACKKVKQQHVPRLDNELDTKLECKRSRSLSAPPGLKTESQQHSLPLAHVKVRWD